MIDAPIVHVDGSFFMLGGDDYAAPADKTIGRLDITTCKWSNAGSLVTARRGHNAIYDGLNILVVGGYPGGSNHNSLKTETCMVSDNRVTCKSQVPELADYYWYPELFLVTTNFCKELY